MPLCKLCSQGGMSPTLRSNRTVIFSPCNIRFPYSTVLVLCIMANISSVLLISMKRRFNFHIRKTFLLQRRHSSEDPCEGNNKDQRVGGLFFFFSPPPFFFFFCCCFCSSALHTVWKLLANNGSIIFRIVTKQDLLVQRIITPNSFPPPTPPQIPVYCNTAFSTLFRSIFQKHLYSWSNSLQQTPSADQVCLRKFGRVKTNQPTKHFVHL